MNSEKKPAILIVDDEKNVLEITRKILESKGYAVFSAENVDKALNILEKSKIDLIVSDHLMPEKTGLDLVVYAKDNFPDIPRILMTGVGNRELYRDAINKGDIFSLIEKPFNSVTLIEVVRNALYYHFIELNEKLETKRIKESYKTIFDKTTDLIQCTDYQGNFIYVNPSWHKTLGYTPSELPLITLFDIVDDNFSDLFLKIIQNVIKEISSGPFESTFIAKDGRYVYLEGTAGSNSQENSAYTITFILRDITERKKAAEEIQSRLKQETMIANIAKLLANTDEPFLIFNSILEVIGNYSNIDFACIGLIDEKESVFNIIAKWISPIYSNKLIIYDTISFNKVPFLTGRIINGEILCYNDIKLVPDSDRKVLVSSGVKSFLVFPIKIGKKTVGILGVANFKESLIWEENETDLLSAGSDILANAWRRQLEINARKLKEREAEQSKLLLIRADRLSALGTMTAGIIHEITQPLNAINISAQTILYGLQRGWDIDGKQTQESLNLIVDQIQRITNIIRDMRVFARDGQSLEKTPDDLNLQVKRVFSMFGEQLKAHNIEFELNIGEIPLIEMNSQQILQVIINIVTNARQALDDSEKETKKICVSTRLEKKKVILEIEDNATGISDNLREKIFDPFFSTKEVGSGTGLGLSISAGFIQEHFGSLDFYNNDKDGATFIITLPCMKKYKENKS